EVIEITLTTVSAGQIGDKGKITINLDQEDGKIIYLEWAQDNADMDLILWADEPGGSDYVPIAFELWKDNEPEAVIIPKTFFDASFGCSYIYYSGGDGDLDFQAQFIDFTDGVPEPTASREIFSGKYTAENKNKWDTYEMDPLVVQTFDHSDGEILNISNIIIPDLGSRMKSYALPL